MELIKDNSFLMNLNIENFSKMIGENWNIDSSFLKIIF